MFKESQEKGRGEHFAMDQVQKSHGSFSFRGWCSKATRISLSTLTRRTGVNDGLDFSL